MTPAGSGMKKKRGRDPVCSGVKKRGRGRGLGGVDPEKTPFFVKNPGQIENRCQPRDRGQIKIQYRIWIMS